MKYPIKQIVFLFSCVFLLCCTNPVEDKVVDEYDSTAIKIAEDSIQEETWEAEEKRLKKEYSDKLKYFKISMQEKTFHFVSYATCNDSGLMRYDEMKKYGLEKPFSIEKKIKEDTLSIKFKFISSCCLEYIGDVEKRNDSLILTYKNISYRSCDCRCYYYYSYTLPKQKYQSKYIVLNNTLIK